MSRTGGSRPEYRLRFGYPYVTVERVGAPPRRISIDGADAQEALRGFAAEIARVGGRLKAVLPASEVWRGFIPAQQEADAALQMGAEALGARVEEVELALGPVGSDGRRPTAAARRETIAEARAFLERAGLPQAEITATPNLPSFGDRSARPAPPARPRPARKPVAPAIAVSGLAAMVALTLWAGPWSPEAQAPAESAVTPAEAPAPALAALPAPPVFAEAPPALARPASEPVLKSAALAPAPAATRPTPHLAPVALAARNLPDDLRPPPLVELAVRATAQAAASAGFAPRPRPVAPKAPLVVASAGAAAAAMAPRSRPAAEVATAAATTPTSPLDTAILELRPRARPASTPPNGVLAASLEVAAAVDVPSAPLAQGPLARPSVAPAAPVRVAARNPSAATLTALAAEASRAATPAAPRAAAPAPAPAFVRAKARHAEVHMAQPQPQPARLTQPTRQRLVEPAVVRSLAPLPQRVRPAAPVLRAEPAAQTARLQQPRRERAFGRQPRLGRDDLALIGIFGGSEGRHALVQLSNGETERVRSGDDIQGVQVTAIGADAVHLRAHGRDTVLKLPN